MSANGPSVRKQEHRKILSDLRQVICDAEEVETLHHAAWVRAADENAMLRSRLGIDPMADLDAEVRRWKRSQPRQARAC